MKLIAIGFIGHYDVYINMTKEEAINLYNKQNPTYTVEEENLHVKEINVTNNQFWAYNIASQEKDEFSY